MESLGNQFFGLLLDLMPDEAMEAMKQWAKDGNILLDWEHVSIDGGSFNWNIPWAEIAKEEMDE